MLLVMVTGTQHVFSIELHIDIICKSKLCMKGDRPFQGQSLLTHWIVKFLKLSFSAVF